MARLARPCAAGNAQHADQESTSLRRSPRKKTQTLITDSGDETNHVGKGKGSEAVSVELKRPVRAASPKVSRFSKYSQSAGLKEISLPSTSDVDEVETVITSTQRSRSIRPLNKLDFIVSEMDILSLKGPTGAKPKARGVPAKTIKPKQHYTSRFVLKEADCVDDYSDTPENEDEETDLSGFIVDDDAELSSYGTSDETSEDEHRARKPLPKPRRRLQRGHRRVVDSDSDKENNSEADLASALGDLDITKDRPSQAKKPAPEIIDLTSSPMPTSPMQFTDTTDFTQDPFTTKICQDGDAQDGIPARLPSLFNSLLKLSPTKPTHRDVIHQPSNKPESSSYTTQASGVDVSGRPHTPTQPLTPPRLKSPSKLLSPSKRTVNHHSRHRQSTDAFWDHHTVNDWNDSYSPKKAPTASPRKNPLAKFAIWDDSDDNDNMNSENDTSSSLPSPCLSPTKPPKSPDKLARAEYLASKRLEKARREAFDAIKDTLAHNLLNYLDRTVTSGKISAMAASTGGMRLIWSKTLRSTAGRANYKRTIEVPNSSTENSGQESPSKRKANHHATIELAEKVIDRESRLVNTLAHEFCHLADFMLGGVHNQPHGPSFVAWAKLAVDCLRDADADADAVATQGVREAWKECEISTKHSYEIEWKYLWVCEGRGKLEMEQQSAALKLLEDGGNQEEGGCGAEYGRHSKSINTERMRCGRCKGRLVQVRPLPRASPVKNNKAGVGSPAKMKVAKRGGKGISGSENSRSGSEGSLAEMFGEMLTD